MAEAEPGADISYTRPMVGIPATLPGLIIGPNTIVQQDCRVSQTFPGHYVVTVSGGIDVIAAPPMKGLVIAIDARASAKDVFVASTTGALPPGTLQAQVLAGDFSLVVGDGTGWRTVPDSAGGGGGSGATFTSVAVKGLVDANVATPTAANAFATSGAGRDGLTYANNDIVVLGQQANAQENGPYVVTNVGGGNGTLVRPPWWATGSVIPSNFEFDIAIGGTLYGGLKARTFAVPGTQLVDTNDPVLRLVGAGGFYDPAAGNTVWQLNRGLVAAVTHTGAGNITFTVLAGLFDLTKSLVLVTPRDPTGRFNIINSFTNSATSYTVQAVADGGAATDEGFNVSIVPLAP